jgi:hypothetical protein
LYVLICVCYRSTLEADQAMLPGQCLFEESQGVFMMTPNTVYGNVDEADEIEENGTKGDQNQGSGPGAQ